MGGSKLYLALSDMRPKVFRTPGSVLRFSCVYILWYHRDRYDQGCVGIDREASVFFVSIHVSFKEGVCCRVKRTPTMKARALSAIVSILVFPPSRDSATAMRIYEYNCQCRTADRFIVYDIVKAQTHLAMAALSLQPLQ